jgi:two-component system OmpR family sensor kinase
MTAEGAEADYRTAWSWQGVRRLSGRTSLRTKLVTALLALVFVALAAMGIAGVSLLRGYVIGPLTGELQGVVNVEGHAIHDCVQAFVLAGDNSRCPPGTAVSWIPAGGFPVSVASRGPGYTSVTLPAPNLSGAASWVSNNLGRPTTAPANSGGGRWRVMGFADTIQNANAAQVNGTVVVGLDATSAYNTLRQLTGVDVIVSVVILFVLAAAGFAVVQANLRPLVEIEETAEEIAEGHLNRRVPEHDPRTEIGSLGRSLNTMLSQIESAFHAREESEAAAHQSEERMRRFIADASHELRTPLTTIRGFAEYYRQRGGLVQHWDEDEEPRTVSANSGLTADDLDRIMHRVEAEAARMGLLVEDLLLLARMDQQRPLAHNPVDLLSLAADAVHDARMLAPNRTIELSVQPGAAFLVNGDEPRLRQVIGNLLSNALTHTPDSTPVEVSISSGVLDPRAATPDPAVILDVKDNGPGMTSDQAQRVFERFYRADQARTRATGGSGLGLAIVAALVAGHGGIASVRTAPGEGATFRVAFPLAPEAHGWDEGPASDAEGPDEEAGSDAPGPAKTEEGHPDARHHDDAGESTTAEPWDATRRP